MVDLSKIQFQVGIFAQLSSTNRTLFIEILMDKIKRVLSAEQVFEPKKLQN